MTGSAARRSTTTNPTAQTTVRPIRDKMTAESQA